MKNVCVFVRPDGLFVGLRLFSLAVPVLDQFFLEDRAHRSSLTAMNRENDRPFRRCRANWMVEVKRSFQAHLFSEKRKVHAK